MNIDEVLDWMNYHVAAFPEWRRQMSALNPEQKEQAVERIRRELSGVSLWDAKQATDKLYRYDVQPKLGQHVREIAKLASNRSNQRTRQECSAPGEWNCRFCHDTGKALVYAGCCTWAYVHPVDGKTNQSIRSVYGEVYSVPPIHDETIGYRKTITMPCCCNCSPSPNHRLEEKYDQLVYGWRLWNELTDEEQSKVLNGVYIQSEFQTNPATMEF